jgi:inhibitor of KinA sporulation pathway (predicted exonuclease)
MGLWAFRVTRRLVVVEPKRAFSEGSAQPAGRPLETPPGRTKRAAEGYSGGMATAPVLAARRFVVFDTEYTCWEGAIERDWSGPGEYREIVQIGAVKIDAERQCREVAAFEVLIRPAINPLLSPYFIALTAIEQAAVDDSGVPFPEALEAFVKFLGDDVEAVYCNGSDHRIVSENCRLAGIPYPLDDDLVANAQPLIRHVLGGDDWISCSDLGDHLELEGNDPKHQGLGDARAVAAAFRIFRRRGLI